MNQLHQFASLRSFLFIVISLSLILYLLILHRLRPHSTSLLDRAITVSSSRGHSMVDVFHLIDVTQRLDGHWDTHSHTLHRYTITNTMQAITIMKSHRLE